MTLPLRQMLAHPAPMMLFRADPFSKFGSRKTHGLGYDDEDLRRKREQEAPRER
jgi:hypothetical protein